MRRIKFCVVNAGHVIVGQRNMGNVRYDEVAAHFFSCILLVMQVIMRLKPWSRWISRLRMRKSSTCILVVTIMHHSHEPMTELTVH